MLSTSRSILNGVRRVQRCASAETLFRTFSYGKLKSSGRVMTQGRGVLGALGQSTDIKDSKQYRELKSFQFSDGTNLSVRTAAAGWGHTATVSESGKLYIFGRPYDFRQLMRIDKIYKFSSIIARLFAGSTSIFRKLSGYYPTPIPVVHEEPISDLSCSAGLTAFLTESGEVYAFGLNRWGQCGSMIASPNAPELKDYTMHLMDPTKVNIPPCQGIDTGLQHCLAVTREGEIYSWGKASNGQLGNMNMEKKDIPPYALPDLVKLEPFKAYKGKAFANGAEIEPLKATQVSAGFAHSAALTTEGDVYIWGKGMSLDMNEKLTGQAIVNEDQLLPRKLELPGGRKVMKIASSNFQLVMLATDGSLWALGRGEKDRNANVNPLRVQTDFHLPRCIPGTAGDAGSDGSDSHNVNAKAVTTATSEVDPVDGRNYLLLPVNDDTLLLKGHHRVTLITPESTLEAAKAEAALHPPTTSSPSSDIVIAPTEKNRANFPTQGIFDVIVHEGEAYLLELELPMEATNEQHLRVVHYSSGWRHNVLIVNDL